MTLLDIERDICRRLDKNAVNLDPETKARLDTFINDVYRELLRLDGINLRDEWMPFNTISGQDRYVLPQSVTQIYRITDRSTGRGLRQVPVTSMRDADPQARTIGPPIYYAVLSEGGIQRQPGGTDLELISVSNQPISAAIVISYEDTSGFMRTVTVQMNDQSNAALPPEIRRVYSCAYDLSTPIPLASGVVLREKVALRTIAILPAGAGTSGLALHQWVLVLWPTPQGIYNYGIDFVYPRRPLTNSGDEPMLPEEFHTLLVWGGCREECLKMDDDRLGYYKDKYEDDVKRLRAFLHQSRGQRWVPSGGRVRPISDLPGNYPASGW
jgi:hypothetical protein